jgi:protein O-mannosyl-transferase
MVAALFALHPLHVETVAWIAERKTLTCTFFSLLTVWSYANYAKQRTFLRYTAVILLFIACLMSKPAAVTLPFILLLLDFWPLARLKTGTRISTTVEAPSPTSPGWHAWRQCGPLVLEKIPLFILAAIACWLTIVAQQDLGAIAAEVPIWRRVENGLVSYFLYLRKMVCPIDLAVLYPLRYQWQWWQALGCGIFLSAISLQAVRLSARKPYFLVGWLWYLGSLVPMIGLVQAGSAAMADRYSYFSLIGIFVLLVWMLADATNALPLARCALASACTTAILVSALCTAALLPQWKTSIRLFRHTIAVTELNCGAHYQLAVAYLVRANTIQGQYHLLKSLEINPHLVIAHCCLGDTLFKAGDIEGAFDHYSIALKFKPDSPEAHAALANLFENSTAPKFRDRVKAASEAKIACELTHYRRLDYLMLHSGTCINIGQLQEAEDAAKRALSISVTHDDVQGANDLLKRISLLRAQRSS